MNEIQNYDIQCTSDKILEKYQERQNKKRTKFKIMIPIFSTSFMAIFIMVLMISLMGKAKVMNPIVMTSNKETNVENFSSETFYSLQYISILGNASGINSLQLSKGDRNESSSNTLPFQEFVNQFDSYYKIIQLELDNSLKDKLVVDTGEFHTETGIYSTKITYELEGEMVEIYCNCLLEKEEYEYEGEIHTNQMVYPIEGRQSLNSTCNKVELSMKTILSETEFILIKQNYKENHYEYSYEYFKEETLESKLEYILNDKCIRLMIEENDLLYEYRVSIYSNKWEISYRRNREKIFYTLTFSSEYRIYEDNRGNIIKKEIISQ